MYTHLIREESMFDEDEVTLEMEHVELPDIRGEVSYLLLNPEQDALYLINSDHVAGVYDLRNKGAPQLRQRISLVTPGQQVSSVQLLSGGISLMVGESDGSVSQWFPVRDESNNHILTRIREFHSQQSPITHIVSEFSRKGFLAADQEGHVGIYHATAHRTLWLEPVVSGELRQMGISPRANAMLIEDGSGRIQFWHIENEHPEVSWSSLWGKVWYESYTEPGYVWQSSASTETFEPKFSLTPISFGTLKAAFYAMIFAVPLAVMGAIFTAYFMSPRMRTLVKPSIEIMEALPTVILGFLAGLWLAPFVEDNLAGVFSIFTLFPLGVLGFAYLWTRLPASLRTRVPDGWEAALLMPVLLLVAYGATSMSPLLELWLFDGNMRNWLVNEVGIEFDQRNSIVVGIAMGFAVIPTIFSITEDAIFGVPRHLSSGSLALGATPWQTMWRVVLLTASPGIFSAVMIGLGRAVGETMIVLMATGNTPVMDMSMFQGMRTLSANIAVEMPESEVDSTHFRVLFLAGMVLFLFTFVFNTLAELIRQRLRKKYSSL
jgi:phosphate transport system permease protein